ncbi:MAG: hypothetical protein IT496_05060 [Gammaproteobacteria bacterium]|nr:hypothetical protein [Gammaproteobacteria bacterium]MCG3143293.1 hypothetical protein [Gammaproteobacteria bacterium]
MEQTDTESRSALLIGIDDTDNLDSRGTGFRARELGVQLTEHGLASLKSVTRHQLFVSPDIPYTSHNSAACLEFAADTARRVEITEYCRRYLARESAPGSDAGLCIATPDQVNGRVAAYAESAKRTVLTMDHCYETARAEGIYVEGLTGTRQGVIGSLAAVGLHHGGNDGRFLWLRGLRELEPGVYAIKELRRLVDIDDYRSLDGELLTDENTRMRITEWAKPILRHGRSVLLVESEGEDYEDPSCRWCVVRKEIIKQY